MGDSASQSLALSLGEPAPEARRAIGIFGIIPAVRMAAISSRLSMPISLAISHTLVAAVS
jgi:hypothetical protein